MTTNQHCPVCGAQDQIVPGCHHTERRVSALKWSEISHANNPGLFELSNRLAAKQIGVSDETVRTFRAKSGAKNLAPGKRKGADGKAYSARSKQRDNKHDCTKLSLRRPSRRTLHQPDRSLPLEKQANLLTEQLFNFVEAWCKTADSFLREHPGIDSEISASIRAISARAADRLWQCATDLLEHEDDDEEAKPRRNVA
jgi:hypothetical protein